jgi:hypothetical protein
MEKGADGLQTTAAHPPRYTFFPFLMYLYVVLYAQPPILNATVSQVRVCTCLGLQVDALSALAC